MVPTLPLNWTHSKIISAAAFRIIGLAEIPRIEFLLLYWIYHSIRIMTVPSVVYSIKKTDSEKD